MVVTGFGGITHAVANWFGSWVSYSLAPRWVGWRDAGLALRDGAGHALATNFADWALAFTGLWAGALAHLAGFVQASHLLPFVRALVALSVLLVTEVVAGFQHFSIGPMLGVALGFGAVCSIFAALAFAGAVGQIIERRGGFNG